MVGLVVQPMDAGGGGAGAHLVMPNYNHARYLESALRAHLGQSLPPLEVIVVDDASTGESVAIVERLATEHPRLRLIQLARNGGVNAAMNRGLSEARGDCVCFSAADGSYYATGIRQTPVERELIYRILDHLQSDGLRDVAPSFREGALMPYPRLRTPLVVSLGSAAQETAPLCPSPARAAGRSRTLGRVVSSDRDPARIPRRDLSGGRGRRAVRLRKPRG